LYRSTNLDSWTPEQLKTMAFGGNNRAHVFFKQHGWTDGGKIEAKYTSRAAELYRQILSKEVAKSMSEDTSGVNSNTSSPVTPNMVATPEPVNGMPEIKLTKPAVKVTMATESEVVKSPKAPTYPTAVKKPIGAKKTGGKIGGLGVRKLTTKV
jgi:ADP-ribosylation factor GTPase-activating protein 2/3